MEDESPLVVPSVAPATGGNSCGGGDNPFYITDPVHPIRRGGRKKVATGVGDNPVRFHHDERRMRFVRRSGRLCPASSAVAADLRSEIRSGRVVKGVDATGECLLVIILDTNDPWSRSKAEVVERGRSAWVHCAPVRATCTYEIRVVDEESGAPDWASSPSIDELIDEVFAGRMIDSTTHRLFKK